MSDPRPTARSHFMRAVVLAVIAIVGSVVASRGDLDGDFGSRMIVYVGAGTLLVAGVLAARAVGLGVQRTIEPEVPVGREVPLGKIVSIAGYVLVALWTLGALNVPVQALLLGGALTGIVLGIAAQQTLGNVFAGIVLLVVRPVRIGERAVLKSSLGEYDGTVTDMGLFYVSLDTERGPVALPNAVVLGAAVGPGSRSA